MKKSMFFMCKGFLLVLLFLGAGGVLFAQLTLNGGVQTGFMLALEDGDLTMFQTLNGTSTRYYATLTASGSHPSGNGGMNFVYTATNGTPGSSNGYIWYRPTPILTIYLGNGGGGGYATPGGVGANNEVGDGVGMTFRVNPPIDGFNFAFTVSPNTAGLGRELTDARYSLGLAYSVGTVQMVANARYVGTTEQIHAAAGFNFTGLSDAGLTALALDVSATNLTELTENGAVTVGPRVAFRAGSITGGLSGLVYVPIQEGQELDFKVTANASFPLALAVTGNVGVGYNLKGGIAPSADGGRFDYRYSDGIGSGMSSEETSSLGVQPWVEFTAFGGTLGVGYGLSAQFGGGNDLKMKHAVYANYSLGL